MDTCKAGAEWTVSSETVGGPLSQNHPKAAVERTGGPGVPTPGPFPIPPEAELPVRTELCSGAVAPQPEGLGSGCPSWPAAP